MTEKAATFPIRGVIEGYYGKPWTFEQRCDLLGFMQEHGMNSYFYAAKYDAYHRERWAELYRQETWRS
jgi:hyaluronoglucosaminidase